MIHDIPQNIEELKKMANNKSSWRDRLSAVQQLKDYDCQQSKDILTRLAIHDKVFTVKEAAFRAVQSMGVTKNGKPIYLGKKPQGKLVKDIDKKLVHVRDSLPEEYTLDEFKGAFKKLYPVDYDVYEGDKENQFDKWLINVTKSLPKKK